MKRWQTATRILTGFASASLAALLVMLAPVLYGLERSGSVSGAVTTLSGGPAGGAMVKVKNAEIGLTVSVISRKDGRYTVPDLPPGRYTILAAGGGFQSDPGATVEVSAGPAGTKNLVLSQKPKLLEAMSSSQFAALMPEGEAKGLIVSLCTHCHKDGLYKIVSRRMSREDWAEAVRKMEANVFGNTHPLELTDHERTVILEYLAKNYGPEAPPLDPERVMAKSWITGAAAQSAVTEFDLPSGAGPHDVAVDSQGICWVAESRPGVLGRFDPQTLTYTRIPIPDTKPNTEKRSVSAAHALEVDPQGRLWLSDHRKPNPRAIQYDPKAGQFTFYPYPEPKRPEDSADVNTIRIHPNGTVWFTDLGGDQILRLDPATKQFTPIAVPSGQRSKTKAHPYGMAIDGDGWVWFAEYETSKMGRIDAKTGEVTEYNLAPHSYPRRMGTDANGNVWFGVYGGIGKLGMADRRTAKITEYPTPIKYSGAYSVSVDKKRNLVWVSELIGDKIARFDLRTKTFVEYPMPTYYSSVRRIEADPSRPNRVWYSGQSSNRVGYLDVLE